MWAPGALLAGALGAAWSLGVLGVALSPTVIWLWRRAGSRGAAWVLGACYYLGAAVPPLVSMGGRGYGDLHGLELVLFAVAASSLIALAWAACWSPWCSMPSVGGAARVIVLLAVTALPGLGVLGVASPLTGAGLWLPGWGWLGLMVHTAALATLTCSVRTMVLWACLAALGAWQTGHASAHGSLGLQAVHTSSQIAGPDDFFAQYHVALAAQRALPADWQERELVVLGEGLGGLWTHAARRLWAASRAGRALPHGTLILGATQAIYPAPGHRQFDAVAVVLEGDGGTERIVAQRAPMPFVLWRPWQQDDGYRAHWLSDGVTTAAGRRVGVVICYEQLLVFPVLNSVAAGADTLVGLANVRGLGGEAVARWQRGAMNAWASLFGLPAVLATNE